MSASDTSSASPNQANSASLETAISLAATINLTGWSERTVWRRLASGSLTRVSGSADSRAMLVYAPIAPHIRIALDPADLALLLRADAGIADAQTDMGLLLLEAGRADAALYWLELAARAGHAEAMHWLARCHLRGDGVAADRNLGLMWLSRSAAAGHVISVGLIDAICRAFVSHDTASAVPVANGRRISLPPLPDGTH